MKRLIFILAALFATAQAQTIQTIGAPTTTVVSRGNFRTDSIFYLPKRTKLPTDSGAVRYQISDSSVYYWTGGQWRRLGVHIDTATMLDPYLRGSGTANYLPKFDATRSVINSKVYESGTNLMFNTTTPSFTTSGISTIENNATSSAVYTFKTADSLRAYLGFGGANTLDINNLRTGDIRFYTSATLRGRFQTDGTFRLNSLTGTGSRIVTADADGVLSATSSATGLVDTLVLSTRDWRQKGDDSLGAIIATKGSGTVTSVATGYGLSGGTITTSGTISADTAILATRLRVGKVVDSLALVKQNVLTNPVTGTGTTNYVPKWTSSIAIGDSKLLEDANGVDVAGKFVINPSNAGYSFLQIRGANSNIAIIGSDNAITGGTASDFGIYTYGANNMDFWTNASRRMRIKGDGELLLNTTTDAGDYKLQVSGNAYVTGKTVLAATSGNVGVGTNASYIIDVIGKQRIFNSSGTSLLMSGATTSAFWQQLSSSGGNYYIGVSSSTGTGLLSGATNYSMAIVTESARDILFGTSNTEKIRIHANGGLKFVGQSAAPTAEAGTVYYDTDDNKLKVYNGTTWVDLH